MSHARLVSVTVERFKSYSASTTLDLKPLTVLVGRNNSGKSTMVQALLLLKQTLESPRADVPLHLVGTVEALNLRELTHGWPEVIEGEEGPSFKLVFESKLDMGKALAATQKTSERVLVENGIPGLRRRTQEPHATVRTTVYLRFREDGRRAALDYIGLASHAGGVYSRAFDVRFYADHGGLSHLFVDYESASGIGIDWDHFIPHLTLDRSSLGPRDKNRIRHNLWLFRMEQPLADLRALLRGFGFLGSTRAMPPTLYRVSASEPPESVGVSGEYAAEILHARRSDVVHYLPPITLEGSTPSVSDHVRARPLVDAVNDVFRHMGLDDGISIDDVKDIGFRLLFGRASLQHVGRGLTYLLPLVEYGLLLDPQRFDGAVGDELREHFLNALTSYSLAAFEEPEAHIHPKLQAQLAHWFVALAMCGRNLIVETHSDHFVRRLRGLIARAPAKSYLEGWLRANVSIVEVAKDAEGRSTLAPTALGLTGDFERWPADFMDAATDEERDIYDASLEKPPLTSPTPPSEVVHDEGEEPTEG